MLGDVLGNPVRQPGGTDRAVAVVESAASHPGRPPQVLLHADWLHWVDHPLFDHELTALYNCLNRQAPFGSSDRLAQFAGWLVWTRRFAHVAGLARHRIRALTPFVFQRLTDSH